MSISCTGVPANWSSSSSSNSTGTPVSKVLVPISAIVIFIVVAAVLFKYHQKIKNAVINCYQRIKNRNKELDGEHNVTQMLKTCHISFYLYYSVIFYNLSASKYFYRIVRISFC